MACTHSPQMSTPATATERSCHSSGSLLLDHSDSLQQQSFWRKSRQRSEEENCSSVLESEGIPQKESEALPARSIGVPVFVMMPLDTVDSDGKFRYGSSKWFHQALEQLASSGVHGIAIDVWWGAVERNPKQYDWSGYRQMFELAKSMGLKIQAVLSFHACGGNVGDSAQIPLPKWVLEAGDIDPDLFFMDKPREYRMSPSNREYISFWADEVPGAVCGRSPIECYTDFMRSFHSAFANDIGEAIEEIVVGCGPCGELRYASYPEINGWRFPGVGEFQSYDQRALASLAASAATAGHPEWGYTGPHDSGEYNSHPEGTGFFCGWAGSWDTPYGHFFLEWYSRCLIEHGERLLKAADSVFHIRATPSRLGKTRAHSASLGKTNSSIPDVISDRLISSGDEAVHSSSTSPTQPSTGDYLQRDASYGQARDMQQVELALSPSSLGFVPRSDPSARVRESLHRGPDDVPGGRPVGVTLKIAGVHWWYRTRAHAAELTAGYFNAGDRDGYRDIIRLCAKYNAACTLTCVEMCDSQHPPEALCGPEGLLRQVKEAAAELGVEVGGENALPCFSHMHIDESGLNRIVYNMQAWGPPLQEEAAKEEAFYNRSPDPKPAENPNSPAANIPPLPDAINLGFISDPKNGRSGKLLQGNLPKMRGLTFLRLAPEMMSPSYQQSWVNFMYRMRTIDSKQNVT